MGTETTRDKSRRRDGLAFFGRVTAGLSHELNNVLTIVNESAGLLDDLVTMAERGKPLNPDRLRALAANVRKQVERGRFLFKQMNRFAHSADEPRAEFDLRQAVENVVHLMRRAAERKSATVLLEAGDSPATVIASPYDARRAVAACLELALSAEDVSAPIRVCVKGGDGGRTVTVAFAAASDDDERIRAGLDFLRPLMDEMGGAAESCGAAEDRCVLLRFSASTPHD